MVAKHANWLTSAWRRVPAPVHWTDRDVIRVAERDLPSAPKIEKTVGSLIPIAGGVERGLTPGTPAILAFQLLLKVEVISGKSPLRGAGVEVVGEVGQAT